MWQLIPLNILHHIAWSLKQNLRPQHLTFFPTNNAKIATTEFWPLGFFKPYKYHYIYDLKEAKTIS